MGNNFKWDDDGVSYEEAPLDDKRNQDVEQDLPTLTSNFSILSDDDEEDSSKPSKCVVFFTNVFRLSFALFLILYAVNFKKLPETINSKLPESIDQLYLHPVFLISIGFFYLLISILSCYCYEFSKKLELIILILALIGNIFYQQNKYANDEIIENVHKVYNGSFTDGTIELMGAEENDEAHTHYNITNGVKLFPEYKIAGMGNCSRETWPDIIKNNLRDGACGVDSIVFLIILVFFVKCWHFGCGKKENEEESESGGGGSGSSSGFSYISNSLIRLFMMDMKKGSDTSVKKTSSKNNNKVGDEAWAETKASSESIKKAKKKAELKRVTKRQSDSFMK